MATGKMTIDFWTHCETDLGKHSIYYLIPYFPTVIGLGWEGAGKKVSREGGRRPGGTRGVGPGARRATRSREDRVNGRG